MRFQSRRHMLYTFSLVTLLFAAQSTLRAEDYDTKDVVDTITALSTQGFFGTISIEKDYFLPPDRSKLSDARRYDPSKLPPGSSERERYTKLHERFVREAEEGASFSAAFDITVGPFDFISYAYDYTSAPEVPGVTVGRNDQGCWLVNEGDPVRYIWSGVPNPTNGNPAYERIERMLYQANAEIEEIVRFGAGSWKRHMLRSISRADAGFVVIVSAPDGEWEVRLRDWQGRLVLAERIRHRGDEITTYIYDEFAVTNGIVIARHIIRTHGPSAETSAPKHRSRIEYRVGEVLAGLNADWRLNFTKPRIGVDEDGVAHPYEWELDLDDAGSHPIRLSETASDEASDDGRSHRHE